MSTPRDQRATDRWVTALLVLGLATISILVYLNSLGNGFVFDDHDLVLDNRLLRGVANIPRVLAYTYRPIRDISYIFDFALWGENPLGFHLTNTVIHAVNTVLVFLLMRRITGARVTAALAAAIFAVHPIQTDAVAYVSGRRDVLFATFYIASFFSYIESKRRRSWGLFALFLILWALSLMTKEMAASLPLVILVWNFCHSWRDQAAGWWRKLGSSAGQALAADKWLYALLAIAAGGYAFLMVFVRHASVRASADQFDYWGGSFYHSTLTVVRVHAWYLKQLILPTPVAQYFGAFEISTSILDWRVLLSLVVISGVVAAAFYLIPRRPLISFGILSYFAMLIPVSQLIPHHELVADHYLYLPIMSFGLVVALGVDEVARRVPRFAKLAYATIAALLVTASVLTVLRNRDWKDEFTVWSANYAAVPNSPRAAFNLGAEYLNRNPKKAEELFRRSLEIDPTYAPTYTALAQLYLSQNRLGECEQLISNGLALPDSRIRSFITRSPERFRSQLTTALAAVKGKQGDQRRGEELLKEAIRLYPANPDPYMFLSTVVYHGKDRASEIDILVRSVGQNPYVYGVLERLTTLLVEDKRYDEAIPFLEQMLRLVPQDFYAHYEMGQIYRTKGDCATSAAHLNAARAVASKQEERQTVQDALIRWHQQCGQ